MDKKKYKQSYIWLKVLQLHDEEAVKEEALSNFARSYKLKQSRLDNIADSTLDKIYDGEFSAPR